MKTITEDALLLNTLNFEQVPKKMSIRAQHGFIPAKKSYLLWNHWKEVSLNIGKCLWTNMLWRDLLRNTESVRRNSSMLFRSINLMRRNTHLQGMIIPVKIMHFSSYCTRSHDRKQQQNRTAAHVTHPENSGSAIRPNPCNNQRLGNIRKLG